MEHKIAYSVLGIFILSFCLFLYKEKNNVENVFFPAKEVKSCGLKADSLKLDTLIIDSIK
jgi:hypothetical protein